MTTLVALAPGLARVTQDHDGWTEVWIRLGTRPAHLFGLDYTARAQQEFADCGRLVDTGGTEGVCVAIIKGPERAELTTRIEECLDATTLTAADITGDIAEPYLHHDKGFHQIKLICRVKSGPAVLLLRSLRASLKSDKRVAVWEPYLTLTTWSYTPPAPKPVASPPPLKTESVVTFHRPPCRRHQLAVAAVVNTLQAEPEASWWDKFPTWLRLMLRIMVLMWIALFVGAVREAVRRRK